jgi:aldose 1-epimerase
MKKTQFGRTADGQPAYLYSISNKKGMRVQTMNYGAAIVSIEVPDRDGRMTNVVLGYDDVSTYQREANYFGAVVGRNCNRISNSAVVIDGVTYQLEDNERGNNLHSGANGVSKRLWSVKEQTENRIVFEIEDLDLQQGFPGNAVIGVTYEVTEENALVISYHAVSDKKTVFNFTNHAYFNLNGAWEGKVLDHTLQINATFYTPIDSKMIPTGELAAVEGTPFDFRKTKTIGRDIGQGYDHNFALDRKIDGVEKVASAYSPRTGIRMEVSTDCLGMQFYTPEYLGTQNFAAFCLETQYFPNAVNEPRFVSPLTDAGEPYDSTTVYSFSIGEHTA